MELGKEFSALELCLQPGFDRSLPNLLCTSNGIGNNGQACGFRAAGASG
jgi:hypothetical protein